MNPPGNVPTRGRLVTLTILASRTATNPVPATRDNIDLGRIYYGYYCLMCHGERGDGNGPVGQSYVPKPTDLASPVVASMTDGQLYLRMLTGVGHDPVLLKTVAPDYRWQLVRYVRTFARKPPAKPTPMMGPTKLIPPPMPKTPAPRVTLP